MFVRELSLEVALLAADDAEPEDDRATCEERRHSGEAPGRLGQKGQRQGEFPPFSPPNLLETPVPLLALAMTGRYAMAHRSLGTWAVGVDIGRRRVGEPEGQEGAGEREGQAR